jgi:hypothetical protein
MEFAITTSPGWSATGGPWVEPGDAMKKLVWSKTLVEGGKRISVQLVAPPRVAGPYQDIPAGATDGDGHDLPDYYRDIVTLAIPVRSPSPVKCSITAGQPLAGLEALQDGRYWPAVELGVDRNGEAWVLFTCDQPTAIRSITLGQPGRRGFGSPQPPAAELQYSPDGVDFRTVSKLPATTSPVRSASFAPITAKYFRLLLSPSSEPGLLETLDYAPGAVPLNFPARSAGHAVSEIALYPNARIHAAEEKAGFAAAEDYYAIATPADSPAAAPVAAVIDVSGFVAEGGLLEWDAPPGPWQIIRLGFSLTGHQNGPAPREATGLEVDKFRQDVSPTISIVTWLLQTKAADFGITRLLSDSIESARRTGPGPARPFPGTAVTTLPWLATLTEIIDSPSERSVLWDFRQTIAALLAQAHPQPSPTARTRGLTYYAEH